MTPSLEPAPPTLYHVSEDPDIRVFEPREYLNGSALVWAIDDEHVRNYLVPRDCPRVTFFAGPQTSETDCQRYLGSSVAVMAIESAWFERVRSCRLFCYHLPGETFASQDATAGYYVSRHTVAPARVDVITDALSALLERGVGLRVMPDLCALRDGVVTSTLAYSIIRWRNASVA